MYGGEVPFHAKLGVKNMPPPETLPLGGSAQNPTDSSWA